MKPKSNIYNVTEHDMDLLIMREIIFGGRLTEELFKAAGMPCGEIIEVSNSVWDSELGESDIQIIVNADGKRMALLIEDKINAPHRPKQYDRYLMRGQNGISEKQWDDFSVLLVAPTDYITRESEAKKYQHTYSYEQLRDYFDDGRHCFDLVMIEKALEKKDSSYDLIENKCATEFWAKYLDYQKNNHPLLRSANKAGPKGLYSSWAQYYVSMREELILYHKFREGYVDLQFKNAANHRYELEKILKGMGIDLSSERMFIEKTGKSASIRLIVKPIDYLSDFSAISEETIERCFEALEKMTALVERFDKEMMKEFINKCTGKES